MPNSRQPMRIFEGTAQPHEAFWRVRNAAESESGEPEMEFYGFISEYSWWEDDITPKKFKDDLNALGAGGPITIRMNSGGGDVIAASVIRSILVDYPGKVTVRIDGLCASAATFVAMGGDVVRMQDTAFFMIHDPSIITMGTVEELKAAIELLKTVKNGIIDAYQVKTKLGNDKIAKMMTDETWMSANEAKALGFVDDVITDKARNAPAAIKNFAILNYANVPAALLANEEPAEQTTEISPEVSRLQAEAKIYLRGAAK